MLLDDRRRLLLCCGIKDFIIFTTTLLQGTVISTASNAGISSGSINIKGHRTDSRTETRRYSGDVYSSIGEVLESLGSQRDYVTGTSTQTSETGHVTYIVYFTFPGNSYGGSLTIGSYDFKKYKTLKFTVSGYSGKGTLTVGNITKEISANGEYSIDIKELKGTYDLKFSSNSVSGYSVNNVYLEG